MRIVPRDIVQEESVICNVWPSHCKKKSKDYQSENHDNLGESDKSQESGGQHNNLGDSRSNQEGWNVYVVIQFYLWFKFYFPLFWGMVMYGNEFKQREIKFKQRIKLNHNIYINHL